jgi:LAGLIDADG endonuclease
MEIDKKWLVGFVDSKDCFVIKNNSINGLFLEFKISLWEKDIQLLYAIKKFFKYGSVEKEDDFFTYRINEINTLFNVIIPFFEKNKLLTKKKLDFLAFRDAILITKKEKNENGFDEDSLNRINKIEKKVKNNKSFVD